MSGKGREALKKWMSQMARKGHEFKTHNSTLLKTGIAPPPPAKNVLTFLLEGEGFLKEYYSNIYPRVEPKVLQGYWALQRGMGK